MENLELNEQEKKELEKRGFLVKENFDIGVLLKSIINTLAFFGMIPFIIIILISLNLIGFIDKTYFLENGIYLTVGIMGTMSFISIVDFIIGYSKYGKVFFTDNGIVESEKIGKGYILRLIQIIKKIITIGALSKGWLMVSLLSTLFTIYFILFSYLHLKITNNLQLDIATCAVPIIYIIVYLIGFSFVLLLGRLIFQNVSPLYAFGNLGENIQNITPEIESESKLIQSEFKKDMNFSILHSGFEKLSSTFSEIVSLVLKLERVEARANKGNLFDSEKYINSLRSDIVTPLSSLQQFLENQKVELLKSQKELSRVRVGGSEESGNIELQSKRSESLIAELDTNIGALEEMIGKMG